VPSPLSAVVPPGVVEKIRLGPCAHAHNSRRPHFLRFSRDTHRHVAKIFTVVIVVVAVCTHTPAAVSERATLRKKIFSCDRAAPPTGRGRIVARTCR
jgi:hypothetical protein